MCYKDEKEKLAVEIKQSCNCAQAVLRAFSDETGYTDKELNLMGAGFGAGMGCLKATCGALCGAQMVLSMVKYDGESIPKEAADVVNEFEEKVGATICEDIRGIKTGKQLCRCDESVRIAAGIVAEKLEKAG